ncbi:hypothetical protein PsorP6_015254 [Peronosclerospora sorghi]|uniref:Uncharacterized protein n=1 Tax=Peronosclerospora sorghi TaxID=230839 RepID=A0ACC0VTY5_9STRA|nr:hypothetical protein PsorP6_015254 [Peronosclerospora sorghi]
MLSVTRVLFLILSASMHSIARSKLEVKVSSMSTERLESNIEHVNFAKQWTLTATNSNRNTDSMNAIDTINNDDESEDEMDFDSFDHEHEQIDTIKLHLPGRVFLSYSNNLPPSVLSYVNVSGDSHTIVETVQVTSNANDGKLEVTYGSSPSTGGYLLTEIYLGTSNVVSEIEIESSAEVVIEHGVLCMSNTNKELQIEMKQASVMYVSSSAISVQDLNVKLEDEATLQLIADSITIRQSGTFEAQDESSLCLFTSSIKVNDLKLDAKHASTICINAKEVTASTYDVDERSKISLPNAMSKITSTGTVSCDKVNTPVREPRCLLQAFNYVKHTICT